MSTESTATLNSDAAIDEMLKDQSQQARDSAKLTEAAVGAMAAKAKALGIAPKRGTFLCAVLTAAAWFAKPNHVSGDEQEPEHISAIAELLHAGSPDDLYFMVVAMARTVATYNNLTDEQVAELMMSGGAGNA